MSEVVVEGLVILLLIFGNGFLAMSEIALVSSRTSRLKSMLASGNRRAVQALELARDPDRLLAAVQIGITLVGVLAGAYAGMTIAGQLRQVLTGVLWLRGHEQALSIAIVVGAITYLTLVLGELAPKRLALSAPERIAIWVAAPMQWLATLTAPIVWWLTRSTSAVLLPFRIARRVEEPVTADEIEVLIDEGADVGAITSDQRELLAGALRLRSYRARDLMVPRTVLARFDPRDRPRDVVELMRSQPQSHYPVVEEDGDTVRGVVRAWDVLLAAAKEEGMPLRMLAQKAVAVPESASIPDVLAALQRDAAGAAVVVDEHGGLAGMVSRDEILRAIGGRAASAISDRGTLDVEVREDGALVLDGLLPLAQLRERLGLPDPLPEEARCGTVGGFVMSRLQTVPETGDAFDAYGLRFEVLELDQRRVAWVLAVPADQPAAEGSGESRAGSR